MSFVKIILPDDEVQVINTDHIIRIEKMGEKVELDMTGGFRIHSLTVQQFNDLMVEIGVAPKPIRPSFYKPDKPVL